MLEKVFPPYDRDPQVILSSNAVEVPSFIRADPGSDRKLLDDFAREWKRFGRFDAAELDVLTSELFDILPQEFRGKDIVVADVGCGSGRWSRWLSRHVGKIVAIDPSEAVVDAARVNSDRTNISWCMARAEDLPLRSNSIDLALCLGVIHHLEDPSKALKEVHRILRHGGALYFYIYYALEQRGAIFKWSYRLSDRLRRWMHPLPYPVKYAKSQVIAALVYWPLARFAWLLKKAGIGRWKDLPLSFYHNKSFRIMRNDALDRFGTSVEKRFTREEISGMLERSGFERIRFSGNTPYWHGVAYRS